ncbi:MAG TPA: S53 family peptidase, partial [Solirubrobacteraceae bacterium]
MPAAQAANARKSVAAASPKATHGAADHGALNRSQRLSLRIYLAPNGGEAALKAAVAAVSDPASSSYRHFLTPAQFRARYAPTSGAVASVSSWLKANGLTVTGVEHARRYLLVRGSAAAVEQAFSVKLHQFRKRGETFRAPTGNATVPAAVAGQVIGVAGLSTETHVMKPAAFPPAFVNARPCSQYYGQVAAKYQADFKTPLPEFNGKVLPYAPCGYTPIQFRAAYEGDTALTGAGQTVAITDAYAAPTILEDANQYSTRRGDPPFAKGQFQQRLAGSFTHKAACGPTGWYGEETLDVEAVHGMAPDAKVLYYGAASCFDDDFADTLNQVVDDNDAQIVTNSWGEPEEGESPVDIVANEQAFQQGALQGISFFFSSGDNGDEVANTGLRQADYPASDPYITAVGGTSTAIGGDGSLAWQTGWGTNKWSLSSDGTAWDPLGFLYGAGGGFSTLFNRPDYQQNGVVPAQGSDAAYRGVPDVAMDADPTTGMLVGETQKFPNGRAYGEYRIGGTSLASPLMAGFQALANQNAGGGQGFLNPALYAAAKDHPEQFLDVKGKPKDAGNVRPDFVNGVDGSDGIVYSVRTFNQDSGLDGDGAVKKGWDEITGIGVPS